MSSEPLTRTHVDTPGFGDELRPSSAMMALVLLGCGVVLGLLTQMLSLPQEVLAYAVLLYAFAAATWLLDLWRPQLGRWFMVCASVAATLLADYWLHAPGALALATIPIALAAALIGLSAAGAATLVESALLLKLAGGPANTTGHGGVIVTVVAIWAMLALMVAVYRPVYVLSGWSWEHFQRAQHLLDEARDRQAELRQALEDLAAANLQLTRMNHLVQGLRQAAEEARQAKEQFVANVSHELRTPLNMIVGFAEMIAEAPASYGDIPPALLADLEVILRNSRHLSSLIDDVLELSQIEAGGIGLARERVVLSEIVEAAVVAVRPLFESKRLSCSVEVPEGLSLMCDRTRIREVLLNLLMNAGRFTEHGGVRIRAQDEGSSILVSVADTGPGIALEDQKKLFQPFQQLDGSIRRRYGGTGLGLSISRNFCELHGGSLWVESEKGKGATFRFRLPKDSPPPLEAGPARWLTPSWEHLQRLHRTPLPASPLLRRLVVLEKGRSLQRLLSRHLDGHEIIPVGSLEEAEKEVAATPAQALLVNGASVADALGAVANGTLGGQPTPVIICSVPGRNEAASTLGASDYLVKPVSYEALIGALDQVCPTAKTVLIADDEPDAQRLFRRMLVSSERGYRVLRASDGLHALNVMRAQRPDVVLLDLIMPGMDGFQLLEAMRADPSLRGMPTIIVSAQDPSGQPIVSSALAVTRRGGLSVRELLSSITVLTDILSPTNQPGGRESRGGSSG